MKTENNPKTYENYCGVLKKMVTLGWYDKYCECGEPIIGVPDKEEAD